MDEEMEDFAESSEFDPDYEFDAAHFFDFTRPESISETDEAEHWFDFAGSYPPSPFIVKLNWCKDVAVPEVANAETVAEVASPRETENEESDCSTDTAPEIEKAKTKSLPKSSTLKTSTLMKPTASYLAKQRQSVARSQKPLNESYERSMQSQPGFESEAPKRQKLETGYLRKVAQLKHQALLSHKSSKQVGPVEINSINFRGKVTIPREPDLETAHRAKSRSFRSKNVSEAGQKVTHNIHTFKARPLNRKILEAPSLALPVKSKPQLPVFRVFHLKTMERAMQHSTASVLSANDLNSVISSEGTDYRGTISESALEQKHETLDQLKARFSNKKEMKEPTEKQLSENPPIELFDKLSLRSKFETNMSKSRSHVVAKGSKENAPSSDQHEIQRRVGKLNKCESIGRNPGFANQPNLNRSLSIR